MKLFSCINDYKKASGTKRRKIKKNCQQEVIKN